MNILHTVQFYYPIMGGSQEVVRQLSEQLVRRGHQVTVATTYSANRNTSRIKGVQIEEFRIKGNSASGIEGEIQNYKDFILNGNFDIMMNYAAQQWASDLVFQILEQIQFAKVLAPCGFSGLYSPRFTSYFDQMPEVMRHYDQLIFHASEYRDIDFARKHEINHFSVLPNGASHQEFVEVDTSFRKRYHIPEDELLLLTVSSHLALKGHRTVLEAFRRARIGKATLVIIGNTLGNPGCLPNCRRHAQAIEWLSFGKKRVLLMDLPRQDVVAAYHAADLFVLGSRVEYSPLVLFEAIASRTPFITSACGNTDEILDWTQGGVVVPAAGINPDGTIRTDAGKMAQVIENLVFDEEYHQKLANAGYQAWLERFTWEKISLQYEDLYAMLIEHHTARVKK